MEVKLLKKKVHYIDYTAKCLPCNEFAFPNFCCIIYLCSNLKEKQKCSVVFNYNLLDSYVHTCNN
jgi:hypothetical protein